MVEDTWEQHKAKQHKAKQHTAKQHKARQQQLRPVTRCPHEAPKHTCLSAAMTLRLRLPPLQPPLPCWNSCLSTLGLLRDARNAAIRQQTHTAHVSSSKPLTLASTYHHPDVCNVLWLLRCWLLQVNALLSWEQVEYCICTTSAHCAQSPRTD